MERGQGAIGWLRWVRRSRLMFRSWKTRFIRDPVSERE